MSEAPMMSNESYNHLLPGMTPDEIAEHLRDICPEFGDLNVDELLLMQESAFHYIQNNNQNRDMASSYGETSSGSLVLEHENEPSPGTCVEHQLDLDEALARALELGDDFNNLHVHEDGASAVDNTRSTTRGTPTRDENQNIRQDDIDPDTMTYEELRSLGESVGGRAEAFQQISSHGYRHSDIKCVICYDGYKNGAKLTTLPCAHQYHSHCITPWLQDNKHCPICQKEVEDE